MLRVTFSNSPSSVRFANRLSWRCVVGLVAVGVVLAGCQSDDPPPEELSSSAVPTSLPVDSSAAPDPIEAAEAQAIDAVTKYYAVKDELTGDSTLPLEDFAEVAVDPLYSADVATVEGYRAEGVLSIGSMVATDFDMTMHDLAAATPTVGISACIDASNLKAVTASGEPVGDPNRPNYWISQMTVVQTVPGDATSWRVGSRNDIPVESCD